MRNCCRRYRSNFVHTTTKYDIIINVNLDDRRIKKNEPTSTAYFDNQQRMRTATSDSDIFVGIFEIRNYFDFVPPVGISFHFFFLLDHTFFPVTLENHFSIAKMR